MERLALSPGATIYVTAKVINVAGLYVIATSEPIVISPQPRLEVTAHECLVHVGNLCNISPSSP